MGYKGSALLGGLMGAGKIKMSSRRPGNNNWMNSDTASNQTSSINSQADNLSSTQKQRQLGGANFGFSANKFSLKATGAGLFSSQDMMDQAIDRNSEHEYQSMPKKGSKKPMMQL